MDVRPCAYQAGITRELTLVDVGEDTALGDGDVAQKLVQLLVVPDGELQVTRDDTRLLVVTGGVASQLENFGGEVLKDGSEVDRSTGTDTLSVVALPEQTVNTTDRESETGLGGPTVIGASQVSFLKIVRQGETQPDKAGSRPQKHGRKLTTARSSCRWPYRRTCRLQSFWMSLGLEKEVWVASEVRETRESTGSMNWQSLWMESCGLLSEAKGGGGRYQS